jgi:hypothetical protein
LGHKKYLIHNLLYRFICAFVMGRNVFEAATGS